MTANTGRRWSLGLTLGVTLGAFGYLFAADRGIDYPEAERQMRLRYGEAGLARLRQWQEGQRPAAPVSGKSAAVSPSSTTTPASASDARTSSGSTSGSTTGSSNTTGEGSTAPASAATATQPAPVSATQTAVPVSPAPAPAPASSAPASPASASSNAGAAPAITSTDPQRIRLEQANRLINDLLIYNDDLSVWEQVDYWATPLETLGRGTGDCEDYALAKYFSLTLMGVPQERLRMVYVRADIGTRELPQQVAHMVLAYYEHPRAEPLILDNLIEDIRPASQRPDLAPVYSFNHDGVWLGADAAKPPAGSAARLSRWRDLLARMNGEGFHFD